MKKVMDKISAEVLIYMQNIKNYFSSNEETKKYFIVNGQDELFYSRVTKISQLNFEKTGQPMLTIDQFELVRVFLISFSPESKTLYTDYKEFGKFFLN